MLKSVAGRQVPFTPKQFPNFTRLSRRIGLRTMGSIGGKVPVCPFEFWDDLETADFSKWTIELEAPYEIVTSPIHHGSYAARTIHASPGYLRHTMVDPQDDYYIRLYFLLTGTSPTGGSSQEFLRVHDEELAIYVITGGAGGGPGTGPPRFELQNLITGAWADGTTTIEVDKWYCLELLAQANNPSAVHKLWLDGVEEISLNDDTSGYNHTLFRHDGVSWGTPYTGRGIVDCWLCGYSRPTCVYYPACRV